MMTESLFVQVFANCLLNAILNMQCFIKRVYDWRWTECTLNKHLTILSLLVWASKKTFKQNESLIADENSTLAGWEKTDEKQMDLLVSKNRVKFL